METMLPWVVVVGVMAACSAGFVVLPRLLLHPPPPPPALQMTAPRLALSQVGIAWLVSPDLRSCRDVQMVKVEAFQQIYRAGHGGNKN